MNKQEKLRILEAAVQDPAICRCWFSYDENYFYYYPNAVNDTFLLGQEEDDFLLDGYAIRKISQLRRLEIKDDACHTINTLNGITAQIRRPDVDISSWQTVFHSLKALNTLILVGDAVNEELALGRIETVWKSRLYFREFDANGVWSEDTLVIPYSCITHVKWSTRYLTTWERYLQTLGRLPS